MTDYLNARDDAALETLIKRSEAAATLSPQQQQTMADAQRILAERSAKKVAPHFDMPRAINFLVQVAGEGRLCSYRDLTARCINDPDAEWSRYYRKLGGPGGLMQSIIRHCAAHDLPQLACLVVRQGEVLAGPSVPPKREGEAEYGFKRGMVDEGLGKKCRRYR